ncbi:MAG: lytic murein transglycosylase [Kangiellaceae bacterium]|nr:lytic murein transglycosylase [Kangiellaceae bacterium]
MFTNNKLAYIFLSFSFVMVSNSSFAHSKDKNLTSTPNASNPVKQESVSTEAEKFALWKASLKPEMLEQGASEQLSNQILEALTYIPRVVELDRHQPEGRMTHEEYLTKVIPEWKVKKAREEFKLNQQKLEIAAESTGVPAHYIVSLWGKETNFGTITGNYSVPSALATLAFDGRRAKFFRKEFLAAVKILAQGHIALTDMKGSWAGAMGNCQFMPSSFLQYAVDADKDGKKDIWSNKDDIFASMGNYLSRYGWDKNKSWGRQVKLTKPFAGYAIGKKSRQPLASWQDSGVRRMDGSDLPKAALNAYLIAPGGKKGRIYLVYPNFDIIMKWNRSHYFATGVGYLADRIAYPAVE